MKNEDKEIEDKISDEFYNEKTSEEIEEVQDHIEENITEAEKVEPKESKREYENLQTKSISVRK